MPGFRVHAAAGGRPVSDLSAGALYFLQALHERFDCERRLLGDDRLGSFPPPNPGWVCLSRWKIPPTLYGYSGTLIISPRAWNEDEPSVSVNGRPLAGALFDFGVHAYNHARGLAARGEAAVFRLSQVRDQRSARLWNDVFVFAENYLGLPPGSVRAVICLPGEDCDRILAEALLYELREHAADVVIPYGRRDLEELARARGATLIVSHSADWMHDKPPMSSFETHL